MMNNTFEKAFSDFLERREYDEAESALFEMVRISFLAGWKAAGGEIPVPQRIFSLVEGGKDVERADDIRPYDEREVTPLRDITHNPQGFGG